MKIILISFIIIYQYHNVSSQVLKKVFTDFQTFGRLIGAVMKGLAERMHKAIVPSRHSTARPKHFHHYNVQPMKIVPGISPSLKNKVPEPPEYKQLKKHPTALLPTDRLILHHQRIPEVHKILTADGYILTLHRVLQLSNLSKNKTVLLHHGLMGSSADWVMLGARMSLPYKLSDAGFDVWMTNARGNYYSQHHIRLDASSNEFWNFSWQEMGESDLSAVIDYIRHIKGRKNKIDFIGHSMGASALLVLLSRSRKYNEYLRTGILLAPLVFMKDVKGPLLGLVKANMMFSQDMVNSTSKEYFPKRKMPSYLSKKLCKGRHRLYCNNPLFFITGGLHPKSPLNKDRDFLATLMSHVPAGASTKTILHYGQLAASGKFHAYNDSKKEFPLRDVTLPLALFSSTDDQLCSSKDVKKLFVNIANPLEHVLLYNQNVTHTEFVWGHRADKLVFSKILAILQYYKPGKNINELNEV